MLSDIVQVYAEAMHVAMMHQPAPPARQTPLSSQDWEEPASVASPGLARRIVRWLAARFGPLDGPRIGCEVAPPARPSRQGCG